MVCIILRRNDKSNKFHVQVDSSLNYYDDTRNSNTGILPYFGIHLVEWTSKRQSIIVHSTADSEYVAADSATKIIVSFMLLSNNWNN